MDRPNQKLTLALADAIFDLFTKIDAPALEGTLALQMAALIATQQLEAKSPEAFVAPTSASVN